MLTRLGWEANFEFRNLHTFPVEEQLYRPIVISVGAISQAIESLGGGYLLLWGPPGSGKSTLLTHTLRNLSVKVVRYYAYIPGSRGPSNIRGEAVNFLHDTVLALHREVLGEFSEASFDRDELKERLHSLLQDAGKLFEDSGRKTVLLVDGLDHIEREQRPERPLFDDLPSPEDLPAGVFVVLGSQTDGFLPNTILTQLAEPGRRIEMSRLARDDAFAIMDQRVPALLSQPQKDLVFEKSTGHPLALEVLLNQIEELDDPQTLDDVLTSVPQYDSHIESQYSAHWLRISSDPEVEKLIALISRMRGPIDFTWIGIWYSHEAIRNLRRTLYYYFEKLDNDVFVFFHESFRLFVLDKTLELEPGFRDEKLDRVFHLELASHYGSSEAPRKWEELYHLNEAGDTRAVLELATQAFFREQFISYRSPKAIQSDISLAMKCAALMQDHVAVTRLILASAELYQRNFHLEQVSWFDQLIATGDLQLAVDQVLDGIRLRVSAQDALTRSGVLLEAGLDVQARTVFELAEPLDSLAQTTPFEPDTDREKIDQLVSWASVAPLFRELGAVLEATNSKTLARHSGEEPPDRQEASGLRNRMLREIGRTLFEMELWDDFFLTVDQWDPEESSDIDWWFWSLLYATTDAHAIGEAELAERFLSKILASLSMPTDEEKRLALANAVFLVRRDLDHVSELLTGVGQPHISRMTGSGAGLQPFARRIQLNRMLFALGDRTSVTDRIPDAEHPYEQGTVYFERNLCVLAHLQAQRLPSGAGSLRGLSPAGIVD